MNRDIGTDGYRAVMQYRDAHKGIEVLDNPEAMNNKCVIYCSSNGVWHPNTMEVFQKKIIDEDRYEWKNLRGGVRRREIFIRDVLKEWYVQGTGGRISSIDAVIEYLRPFVEGYELVTVGNSAGGYLATILGIVFHALFVLNISGQFDITQYTKDEETYPELYRSGNDPGKSKYFNIRQMLKQSQVPVFYMYAAKCGQDKEQFALVRDCECVYPFAFDSASHGAAVLPFNYPVLLDYTLAQWLEIQKLYDGKVISPAGFAKRTMDRACFRRLYPGYWMKHFPKEQKLRLKRILVQLGIWEKIRKKK